MMIGYFSWVLTRNARFLNFNNYLVVSVVLVVSKNSVFGGCKRKSEVIL